MHEFHVPELHCQSCVTTLAAQIRRLDPVAEVNGLVSERRLLVKADLSESELLLVLSSAGYAATPIT
ncbi:heavy-metal-associated domain-containing protein [Permianibacter aggregans]|uniref:Copper chaperone n=1 Tax=Permianibacter aggregans TaxID=1510150 RepID=A0A4R6UJI4_9GAMM|nr:heavy-metal-associated domain-containing protein [Permianibacter aggregans]QGX39622.1 copper chaperone [Permianibacter aggregans]TDQ45473.1 copper chaperone [Permianibacter aggregans]